MYVPIVYGFLPEINAFVFVFVFGTIYPGICITPFISSHRVRAGEYFSLGGGFYPRRLYTLPTGAAVKSP